MTKQCGLELISKLRVNTALYFQRQSLTPDVDAPACMGSVSIRAIDAYGASLVRRTQTLQLKCIKRNYITKSSQSTKCGLYPDASADAPEITRLVEDAETLIDYYALRFQIEFNFRDAKQFWGLEDFMNVDR